MSYPVYCVGLFVKSGSESGGDTLAWLHKSGQDTVTFTLCTRICIFQIWFVYDSPLLLIVDSFVSNTEMSWWVIFQINSTVFLYLGCRIPWLAALASVQGDVSLAISTNLNPNNVTAVEIKMMFHSS